MWKYIVQFIFWILVIIVLLMININVQSSEEISNKYQKELDSLKIEMKIIKEQKPDTVIVKIENLTIK